MADSQMFPDVKYARVLDTRLEAVSENHACFALEEGANVTSYVPLTSSSHSNQNTNFNLNNVADYTCRDSRLPLKLNVQISITVNNPTANPVKVVSADNFGFKQYPINRAISSVQHKINQASYTLNTNEIIDGIARLNLVPEDCNFYDNSAPDLINSYANATGSTLNPLQSYSSTQMSVGGVYKPRSLNWSIVSGNDISANSTGTCLINAELYEPLVSPFNNISKRDRMGLYGINGEIINIQWVSDLFNNMVAYVVPAGCTLTTGSVNLGTSASLMCIYLTPKEQTTAQIPEESIYQYNDYTVFTNTIGSNVLAGQQLNSISSQVVNFTNIPQKIIVYARISNGDRTCATPDKYLSIQNATFSFDNGNPQLSSATPDQLYDISTRNGLQLPRASFKQSVLNASSGNNLYGCGSVLVIDPCLDLGVRSEDTVGSGGRYIFQMTNANLLNNTNETFTGQVTLYVVGINSAVLKRVGTQYTNYLLTTPRDVINNIRSLPAVSHANYVHSAYGNSFLMGGGIGNWFKKLKDVGSKAFNWAMANKDTLKQAYDVGKKLTGNGMDGMDGGMVRQRKTHSRLFGARP